MVLTEPPADSTGHVCVALRLRSALTAALAVTQRWRANFLNFLFQKQLCALPRGEYMLSLFLTEADGSRVELRRADGARQVATWRTEQNSAAHMRSRRC